MPTHQFVEHTGEIELRVHADNLSGIFEEAGRALAELMLEAANELNTREVLLCGDAPDRAALLVEWINELIYHSEVEKLVFIEFEAHNVTEQSFSILARGVTPTTLRTAVKGATFHRISVVNSDEGVAAIVVLDV